MHNMPILMPQLVRGGHIGLGLSVRPWLRACVALAFGQEPLLGDRILKFGMWDEYEN